uniref:Uncharacterized protein n=1 Tax=Arundo donax TaxID=35708 RepID=A0A0A8YZ05_ARUDO
MHDKLNDKLNLCIYNLGFFYWCNLGCCEVISLYLL